ncbi:sulfate transport system ATP-binding protein [Methylophilaceae bacterium]|nr:sulfate transport system ATP-binding protein [Methylophilaceae bacterium]
MIEISASLLRPKFTLQAELKIDQRVTGLFGPSGSGKSTLLNILAGLVRPDHGSILVDQVPLFDSAAGIDVAVHRRHVGLVFQDSRLFPHMTVRGNLEYGLKRLKKSQQMFSLHLIVELLELERLLDQKPHQLSGGEKQRVALGRALLSAPRLLLMDEPLASLDSRLKNQILPFLKRITDEIHIPMIYVSHAINEILHLTPNIAFIEDGKILAHGNFHEILHQKEVLKLAHSLGLENVVEVHAMAHEASAGYTVAEHAGREMLIPLSTATIGRPVTICIPASSIALSAGPIERVTIQNQIPGVIVAIESIGHRVLVSVDIGSVILAEVTVKAIHELKLECGAAIYCLFKTQSIRVLGL